MGELRSFLLFTLKKLSSRYPGTTLGTWPMVKHCKTDTTNKSLHSSLHSPTHQRLLSFPSQPKGEGGPVVPSGCQLPWGTGGRRMLCVQVGKGSELPCQLIQLQMHPRMLRSPHNWRMCLSAALNPSQTALGAPEMPAQPGTGRVFGI